MTLTGNAQVFVGANHPFEWRSFPLPDVERKGLLVKVSLSSVCGTDLHIWHGKRTPPIPIILGHEAMGVIEKKGSEVEYDFAARKVKEGDRIAWSYIKACGECYYCVILNDTAGCQNRFVYGLFAGCDAAPYFNGAFSEYIYLRPGTTFFKLADDLQDEIVAPANCALVTMVNVLDRAKLRLGENVVIQGCGPLGLYAASLARESGASNVIVLDAAESRLQYAESFGANYKFNVGRMNEEELVKKIKELTGGLGADLVIEATGVPSAIPTGLKLPRDGGRYITIGPIFQGAAAEIDLFNLIFKRISLIGTARNDARNLFDALAFLSKNKGKYPFQKIVGEKFKLQDIEAAFKAVDDRRTMRAAISA